MDGQFACLSHIRFVLCDILFQACCSARKVKRTTLTVVFDHDLSVADRE